MISSLVFGPVLCVFLMISWPLLRGSCSPNGFLFMVLLLYLFMLYSLQCTLELYSDVGWELANVSHHVMTCDFQGPHDQ